MENKTTALIVDDFDATYDLLRTILERAGFRVIRATKAQDAYRKAVEEHPELILMDVQLEEGNGMAATRLIREDAATMSIPIIAMSSISPYELRQEARAAGCDEYLSKPFKMADLAWRIHKVMQTSRRTEVHSVQSA